MSEYRVVPFIGQVKTGFFSGDSAAIVAAQLQAAIAREVADGWEFHSLLTRPGAGRAGDARPRALVQHGAAARAARLCTPCRARAAAH